MSAPTTCALSLTLPLSSSISLCLAALRRHLQLHLLCFVLVFSLSALKWGKVSLTHFAVTVAEQLEGDTERRWLRAWQLRCVSAQLPFVASSIATFWEILQTTCKLRLRVQLESGKKKVGEGRQKREQSVWQGVMLSCCCSVIFGQLIKQLQPREKERATQSDLSTLWLLCCSRSHPLYTYHISNCSLKSGAEGREGNVARLAVNHMWERVRAKIYA